MQGLIKFIIPLSLLTGGVMANALKEIELIGMPGLTTPEKVQAVFKHLYKGDPYIIIEKAWPFMDKRKYYEAARWICLAWQHGYSNGEAISGWLDDWKDAGGKGDLRILVKAPAHHEDIARVLAAQWEKDRAEDGEEPDSGHTTGAEDSGDEADEEDA
jgi:hypothetical protein